MSLKSKKGLINKISQFSRPNPKRYNPFSINTNSPSRGGSSNSPTPSPSPSAGAFSNAFSNAFNI